MLQGQYVIEGEPEKVLGSYKAGLRKRLSVNDKEYKRFSDHVGRIPLVMISPSDSLLVSGGSEERRRFMDVVISQYDINYLNALIRYDKALKQRNALLKQEEEPDTSMMDVLEGMMSQDASLMYERCKTFVAEFLPIFQELDAKLGRSETEQVDIQYTSHGARGNFEEIFRTGRPKERIVGHSLYGTHRDELDLLFNGFSVKHECSQGQTKTFFITMKLAQYLFLKGKGAQRVPILLLDDIFDKLDATRVNKIVQYVSGADFGQIFITDTHREHLDSILSSTQKEYKLYTVVDGVVHEE
jgi:DNA replication and repair protein RecF